LATPLHEGDIETRVVWYATYSTQFILHLLDTETGVTTQLAFLDARRLGRIRLCKSPLAEPPISELGFDPILSMPSFEEFKPLVLKRSCPIKALLLDQSFSAGVGNWVAGTLWHIASGSTVAHVR
jgi:formamidopyrimidine-DNA glycosylase